VPPGVANVPAIVDVFAVNVEFVIVSVAPVVIPRVYPSTSAWIAAAVTAEGI